MTAMDVGNRLVSLCKEYQHDQAFEELYADDVVSVEPQDAPGQDRTMTGKEAVRAKQDWWNENFDVHSLGVEGPFPHGSDRFAAIFDMDVTFKPTGERTAMREVAVYTVVDGMVVKEEFFYAE